MDLTDEQWEVLEPRSSRIPLAGKKMAEADPGQILGTRSRWHHVDSAHRSALEGPARTLPSLPADLPAPLSEVDRRRGALGRARSFGRRPRREGGDIDLSECYIETPPSSRPKKGGASGKDQAGQGFRKIMAFSEGSSVPLALHA
jgi:hypothetical protein